MPHDAIDPIPVLCAIVTALQTLVTRRISVFDPAVITIARIEAGTTDNVIPEDGRLWGTLRTLSEHTRAVAHQGIHDVAEHVALAHGARAEVTVEKGFPVTVCDGRVAELAERTARALYGEDGWFTMKTPMMGAEDFSYVLQKTPGAMAFLGAAPEGGDYRTCCALHSNRMDSERRRHGPRHRHALRHGRGDAFGGSATLKVRAQPQGERWTGVEREVKLGCRAARETDRGIQWRSQGFVLGSRWRSWSRRSKPKLRVFHRPRTSVGCRWATPPASRPMPGFAALLSMTRRRTLPSAPISCVWPGPPPASGTRPTIPIAG